MWKDDKRIELRDLVAGDELVVNRSGLTATGDGVCTDIWVGPETFKLASDRQRSNHQAFLKGGNLTARVESVEGKALTILLFSGNWRQDAAGFLDQGASGDVVTLIPTDDEFRPLGGPPRKAHFEERTYSEASARGVYGSSGVRWRLETEGPDGEFRPGQLLRVTRDGW